MLCLNFPFSTAVATLILFSLCISHRYRWHCRNRDVPHILLLDEPTNHLDMSGIDALAKAINEFEGGLVLVSHDMRLIGQVAKEIWVCDQKKITKYKGDILNFKMDMRKQMNIDAEQKGPLRGDASVRKKDDGEKEKKPAAPKQSKLEVVVPKVSKPPPPAIVEDDEVTTATTVTASSSNSGATKASTPAPAPAPASEPKKGSYVPPHLRRKMQQNA